MNGLGKACVVALSVFVSQAYAQDDGAGQTQQTETVNAQMAAPPGFPAMNVNMNVQVQQTTTQQSPQPTAVAPPSAPAPAAAERDCGTGRDPGCTMMRRGNLPMDADEFTGLLQSLKGNPNELEREDMVKSTLSSSYLTAKQLGRVLDLFENEINRFEVAQVAAPQLVNPKHALRLSTKFQNSITASDFVKLVNAQRD